MIQPESAGLLKITTFGRFRVELRGEPLSEGSGRASKIWELFRYLVTYRDRDIPNDTLIENLWENEWPSDPARALRNLIYRLRKALFAGTNNVDYIVLSGGFYRFNTGSEYWLDAEEFVHLANQAKHLSKDEPLESMRLYQQCLSLYQGEYLPCNMYSDWVLPIRNYYRRLYVETFQNYIGLLEKHDALSVVGAVCEHALQVEPLEESVHIQFIDYLLRCNKPKAAQTHYNYASALFYREMGAKPSAEMADAYRRICLHTKSMRPIPGAQ
ncbi:MAG: hypothetical protein GX316_01350 [Firmicutes bacterium]|nr:hypothetical protein [Bacillota bacterium]